MGPKRRSSPATIGREGERPRPMRTTRLNQVDRHRCPRRKGKMCAVHTIESIAGLVALCLVISFGITAEAQERPRLLKDINTSGADAFPRRGRPRSELTDVNGTLFFVASDGVRGRELWRSDGTVAGTLLLKDINPGADDSDPAGLTNVNGTLFFTALEPTTGRELWKSDGTPNGTVLVRAIVLGLELIAVEVELFFGIGSATIGSQLWKSDGTAEGTVLVKELPEVNSFLFLAAVNGTVFLRACEPTTGCELWKSDGTANGTILVKDINPGPDDSLRNPRVGIGR